MIKIKELWWCSFLHQWSVTEGAAPGLHSVIGAGVGWEVLSMMDISLVNISLYATSWTECRGQSGTVRDRADSLLLVYPISDSTSPAQYGFSHHAV